MSDPASTAHGHRRDTAEMKSGTHRSICWRLIPRSNDQPYSGTTSVFTRRVSPRGTPVVRQCARSMIFCSARTYRAAPPMRGWTNRSTMGSCDTPTNSPLSSDRPARTLRRRDSFSCVRPRPKRNSKRTLSHDSNIEQTMAAPAITAIVGSDQAFYEALPRLYKEDDERDHVVRRQARRDFRRDVCIPQLVAAGCVFHHRIARARSC